MFSINIISFILIITQLYVGLSLPQNISEYIMGGWATAGPYPYMVELRSASGGHGCGGSIYNEYWIITAGHCSGKYGIYSFKIKYHVNI